MAAGAPVIPSVGDRAYNHSKESKAHDTFMHMCELRESLWLVPRNGSKVCTCVARDGRAETLKPLYWKWLYTAYSTRVMAVWNPRPGAR